MNKSGRGNSVKRTRVSDSSGDEINTPKRDRRQSAQLRSSHKPGQRNNLSVSDIINEANSVLYEDTATVF